MRYAAGACENNFQCRNQRTGVRAPRQAHFETPLAVRINAFMGTHTHRIAKAKATYMVPSRSISAKRPPICKAVCVVVGAGKRHQSESCTRHFKAPATSYTKMTASSLEHTSTLTTLPPGNDRVRVPTPRLRAASSSKKRPSLPRRTHLPQASHHTPPAKHAPTDNSRITVCCMRHSKETTYHLLISMARAAHSKPATSVLPHDGSSPEAGPGGGGDS